MTLSVTRVVQISVAGHETNSTTYAGTKFELYLFSANMRITGILSTVFTHSLNVPKP